MNVLEITAAKKGGRRLSMVTCYDAWSAKLLNRSPIDMLLVGDSSAMVMHGYADTLPATVEMISAHVGAVARGAPKKFIIADLPFLSFRGSLDASMDSVRRLMQAGAHAVKLEGFDGNGELVRHLTRSGVPVMGHVGLTPQFVNSFGGFKVQGREEEKRRKILDEAIGLAESGAFAVVLECIPAELAAQITREIPVPTIGIGAGPSCDGQVLVLQDMLGLSGDFRPRFVRRYLNGDELLGQAFEKFHADVTSGNFPSAEESYE
jgi:3-methyl-2-oxobutanoate hydroxymethyltransferase